MTTGHQVLLIRRLLSSALALLVAAFLPGIATAAPFAYVPSQRSGIPGGVNVIDVANDQLVASIPLPAPTPPIAETTVVSSDGRRAYVLVHHDQSSLRAIDTATNTEVARIPLGPFTFSLALSPDGTRAYVAGDGLTVVDTTASSIVTTVPMQSANGVAVSPDGSRVYAVNSRLSGSTLQVVDSATNQIVDVIPVPFGAVSLAVSSDGSKIYIPSQGKGGLVVFDVASKQEIATIPAGNATYVALSPDGKRAYVTDFVSSTGGDGRLVIIDTTTDAVLGAVSVGSGNLRVFVASDGRRVYVQNVVSRTISVVDPLAMTVVATFSLDPSVPLMRAAGVTAETLRAAWFGAGQLLSGGYTPSALLAGGFSPVDVLNGGATRADLEAAGVTAATLLAAGATASQLLNAGLTPVELIEAGVTVAELKAAGISATALRDAGVSAQALLDAGFTADQLPGSATAARAVPVLPEWGTALLAVMLAALALRRPWPARARAATRSRPGYSFDDEAGE